MQRVSDHIRDIHWPRPSIETAMRLVLNDGGVVLRWYSKTIDGVWKLRIHPVGLSLVVLALFFFPVEPWCRLMLPPSMADVRALAERAPLVFRGHVLTVTPIRTNTEAGARVESIAKIQIDRWYRGKGSTEALLRFAHSGEIFANGHDCIDFRPETYWTVFAAVRKPVTLLPVLDLSDCRVSQVTFVESFGVCSHAHVENCCAWDYGSRRRKRFSVLAFLPLRHFLAAIRSIK